jgi:TonB family protein
MKTVVVGFVILLLSGAVQSASAQQRDTVKTAQTMSKPSETEDEYIDVSEEPKELTSIEQFIVYPDSEKRAGIEGKVVVQALIGKDGHVEKANAWESTNNHFEKAAIDAVMKTTFSPAKQNSTPLRIWITRTINFNLYH